MKLYVAPAVSLGLQAGASSGTTITFSPYRATGWAGHTIGVGLTAASTFGIAVQADWVITDPDQPYSSWKDEVVNNLKTPIFTFGTVAGQEFSAALVYTYTDVLGD